MKIKKIVIALDSFKGSVSSLEAGQALADGIKESDDKIDVQVFSVADGGEGTLEALHQNCGGIIHTVKVNDPLFRPINANYVELSDGTAVIEMATASGLPLVEKELRNPMNTTTFGTGELIEHALDRGIKKIILAIGGSATNDAGIGMLSALGVRFLDQNNNKVSPIGGNLDKIVDIDISAMYKHLIECEFEIACDVDNPLYGGRGAAYIYAPQKGATPEITEKLDQNLMYFANLIKSKFNKDIAHFEGAGAAGGIGAGLMAFSSNIIFRSGIDIVLDQIAIDDSLKDADLVFVGEGRLDKQTAMGKAPIGIAKRSSKYNIPVIAIGGGVDGDPVELHDCGIMAYFAVIGQAMSIEEAMDKNKTINGLKRQGRELMKIIKL